MTYRLKKPDGSIVYPFAKEQLRSHYPNTSFPSPIPNEIAAEFGCLPVTPTERPEHDPRIERLVEGDPEELDDGTLRQVLTVRDATEEEIAAWDAANQPPPDWIGFAAALAMHPDIATFYESLPLPVSTGITTALSRAASGEFDLFVALWTQITNAGLMTDAAAGVIAAQADAHHLPGEFVGAIGGTS